MLRENRESPSVLGARALPVPSFFKEDDEDHAGDEAANVGRVGHAAAFRTVGRGGEEFGDDLQADPDQEKKPGPDFDDA